MTDPESLDAILTQASTGAGVAVQTTSPQRLRIELQARLTFHRQSHPDAFKNIAILASRSPLELYIVNKEVADAERPPEGAGDTQVHSED